MSHRKKLGFYLLFVFAFAASASAHYGILLPQNWSAERDREVMVTFQWGHPFEHEISDATRPEAVALLLPDGSQKDLTKNLTQITTPAGADKKVTAYSIRFTPTQRGDHVVVVTGAPLWMESEGEFWQDTVRVTVHVAAQKGWDATVGKGFEMAPLTRPYGLRAGLVFQAQALFDGKPVAKSIVEVERYNATPPKELPPDEQITRVCKTDDRGTATCTLDAPGWWCITARRDGGTREREGKAYPVRQRATLWVWVDDSPSK
jgi:cobalt/nickel transport protein